MSPFLITLNLLIGVFAFGLFATDIFVNAGQVVTGHLTPYFLTVCKPNYTSADCRAHHQFINNGNICTGDLEVIEKARRSFPSKHAALSIYSALYATVSKPVLPSPKWSFGWDGSLRHPHPHSFISHLEWFLKSCYSMFLLYHIVLLPPPLTSQCKTCPRLWILGRLLIIILSHPPILLMQTLRPRE